MTVELDDVLPAIHAEDRLDERQTVPAGPRQGARVYREALTDGLVVAYAEDGRRGVRLLLEEDVAALSLEEGMLRARAVKNLRRRLRTVDRHGGPDVHMISAGGTYEGSLLLADEFWSPATLRVDGDFVVALPSRDLLMVTGSRCPVGVARLRQLARDALEKGRHPVTADLLVRRDGRWSVLPAWSPPKPERGARSGFLGFLQGLFAPRRPADR